MLPRGDPDACLAVCRDTLGSGDGWPVILPGVKRLGLVRHTEVLGNG
jgi:hypothetical protein